MPTLRFTAQLQITTAEFPVTARNLSRKTAIAAILKANGTRRNLKSKATCFQAHGGRRRLKNLSLSPSVTYVRSRGVQARVVTRVAGAKRGGRGGRHELGSALTNNCPLSFPFSEPAPQYVLRGVECGSR